jgi:SAM-dependent methyltransferase
MICAAPEFERRAADYERHARVQADAAAWLAEWLPARLDGPALELGAGTGLFTRLAATRADSLTATDIAPSMVAAGRLAVPGADWREAAADTLPAGPWQWIMSCSLAQWLAEPHTVLGRWRAAAAPDSTLLAGWFIKGTMAEFFDACPEAAPFAWRDAEEWLGLLHAAGWSVTRHETRTFFRRHADARAMLREVHNVGAVVPRRVGPGALRRALRAHNSRHGGDRGLVTPFVFLRVEARAA